MTLRITNLRIPVQASTPDVSSAVARRLRMRPDDLANCRILRQSLDARNRMRLEFVVTAAVDLVDVEAESRAASQFDGVEAWQVQVCDHPEPGPHSMDERPIVVGSGPAGLLAAYYLAWRGYRPLVIERGRPVKDRVPAIRHFDRGGEFEAENNYLFGEGGAGCFSDGKLTCRITGLDVDWVLDRFVECGGRSSLVYENRPHLGSNRLPLICRNFRRRIESLGGEYEFGCRLEGIDRREGQVVGIMTSSGYKATRHLLLAIGHSARDTYEMLHESGLPFQQKAFQLGVRIEHPQDQVNHQKYGHDRYLDLLGAADYSLVARGEHDLFSFCMCAGGIVIPSVSESGRFCSNGMSNSRHDSPYANSGLVVTLAPEQFGSPHPLAGMYLQRRYETAAFERSGRCYAAPIQSALDFVAERPPSASDRLPSSYERGTRPMMLDEVLPPVITRAIRRGLPVLDQKWNGRYLRDATLVGPEMRGSSPVRIERDRQSWECPGFQGLYPIGEGAGYAGGIVTAAVDGLRAARKLVERFAPPGS